MFPELFDAAPWMFSGGGALYVGSRFGLGPRLVVAGIRRDRELALSCIQAARIRRRWSRLARHLGLVLVDRTASRLLMGKVAAAGKPRYVVPKMRVRPDQYGVIVDARTVPGVGLQEWQKAACYLADEWRAVRVAVTQPEPGRIRVRAVRRDPLTTQTRYAPDPETLTAPNDLSSVPIGTDEYAEPVSIRLSGVSGIGIYGLPGYGKTSLINGLITRLSPHPAVQFIGLDGKTSEPEEGDYGDVAERFALLVGDDLEQANKVLGELVEFRRARARSIRTLLGVKNVWHVGFTPDWPLLLVIIDEAHTYFSQVKDGGDRVLRARNALAAQNVLYVEDLIKKGRSVGIITILATQKGTGDAIPTQIRDVCAVSLAFACRTIEAAVAALGEDIRQYPEANPVALQDPAYIGVASMVVQGRPGFTRVRIPYVPEKIAAAVATRHRELVVSRGSLPPVPRGSIGALDQY